MPKLFEKTAPFVGMEKIWPMYLIDDNRGQEEIENALSLIHEKFHPNSYLSQIILVPPSREKSFGSFLLGDIYFGQNRFYPFGIRPNELTSHLGIFGRSGAGKTSLVVLLIKNLIHHNIPFLLFDWKREYAGLSQTFPTIKILYAGGENPSFRWNPFVPPIKCNASEYQNYLKDLADLLVQSYFPKMNLLSLEGMKVIFLETADKICRDLKTYNEANIYPTFAKIFQNLKKPRQQFAYAYTTLYSCLESLSLGTTNKIYNTTSIDLQNVLATSTILELNCGSDADKRFLTNAIFYWIYQYRLQQEKTSQLKHALIMEEAHHNQGELLERIYRMIRAFGQSLIFIDQHPSLLSVPIFGNMYTTVCLNLKHQDDIAMMANTFSFYGKERNFIDKLSPGQAIVKLQGRYDKPFLIHFPFVELSASHKQRQHNTSELPQVNEDQQSFLINIWQNPQLSTVERYKSLDLNPRKGNEIRKQLLSKNLIRKKTYKAFWGKMNLLELTEKGTEILQKSGISTAQTKRHGGSLHQYLINQISQKLKDQGYEVCKEFPIGSGKTIDIMLFGEEQIAIEIETGKSDIPKNIEKCIQAGYRLIIVVPSHDLRKRISEYIEQHYYLGKVRVVKF